MILTPRRAELRAKVLAACEELIGSGRYPTGRELERLCPGHAQPILIRIRDELIDRQEIDHTVLWPDSTEEYRFELGPADDWRPRPPRNKRRDARRSETEVRP